MILHKSISRKAVLVLSLIVLCLPLFAGKNDKELQTGKILQVKKVTASSDYRDAPSSDNRNSYAGAGGPAYSTAPVVVDKYGILLDTGEEILTLTFSIEATAKQPEIKENSEVQYRLHGTKQVQIIDGNKRKFDFTISKREPKTAAAATQK
jgi:hypothetical protein